MAKITVFFGNDVQSERTLDRDELKIGRAIDCDIVVDNLGVSRHHCTIVREDTSWVVVDGGSNNGTFVNGGKITRHTLKLNDRVVLGKHSLVFDPVSETFPHDAEANSHLSRNYRAPFVVPAEV